MRSYGGLTKRRFLLMMSSCVLIGPTQYEPTLADYIREKRWHPSQQLIELEDGSVELRLKLSSLVEIQRWILSWGGHAIALAPNELAGSVKAAAEMILERARQG